MYPHKPSRVSHSQLMLFRKDPEEYYIKYICKAPRIPQTPPMSVGSAFDAFVKCHLEGRLRGWSASAIATATRTLFESQVEPQNWDFAWKAGAYAFSQYCSVGCDERLLVELSESTTVPVFEGKLECNLHTPNGPVPIIGFPDLWWTRVSLPAILDWKVNGYCSKSGISPAAGYSIIYNTELYGTRGGGKRHKDADDRRICDPYHDQLATYLLMLGHSEGTGRIDQLVCAPIIKDAPLPQDGGAPPKMRVAIHHGDITTEDTTQLLADYGELWHSIQTETIVSPERAEQLSKIHTHAIHNVMRQRSQRY